jgi:hypothetical protein
MKFVILVLALLLIRDDGRYANSPLKPWFDKLKSEKGMCCSFADGISISDVDWDTKDGHYRVKVPKWVSTNGWAQTTIPASDWIDVPDSAVVHEPNRFGPAVVWPYIVDGQTAIRCFIPGAGT